MKKKCPFCGSMIKKRVLVGKFCGEVLPKSSTEEKRDNKTRYLIGIVVMVILIIIWWFSNWS